MKTMKFLTMITFALFIGVTTISCSGDDGDTGPQGTAGVDGTNGTDGQDGNANVIASDWFDAGTWTDSGTTSPFFNRVAVEVTQEIIDSGVVLAYASLVADVDRVRPLSFLLNGREWGYHIPSVGNLIFTISGGGTFSPSTTNRFRYIIIPSSTSGRSSINFEEMSYEEVMDYYGLDY